MTTVRGLLDAGAKALPGDAARREAALLLGHALGQSNAWLVAHAGDTVDAATAAVFQALIARRAEGEPVAYLTGKRGFYTLELAVTPDVLIPRPETELLVECALQRLPLDAACSVADLGTGSGAVALAVARARPNARVLATDTSESALGVARRNAARLAIGNVAFALGDWCAALGNRRFEAIVANPPYIAAGDPHLARGDLRFEPAMALASGPDGLDAIRVIVQCAPDHLRPGGWLLFEHGYDQGTAARALLAGCGYVTVFTARDLEGRERVSGGRRA